MKKIRNGKFIGQNMSDAAIKKKILDELGQGNWEITYHVSGSVIHWNAETIIMPQGPQ